MPHSINTDICEGIAQCAEACPVNCIERSTSKNKKGTDYYYINFSTCIDCGVCLAVCPIKGAVLTEERPDLQRSFSKWEVRTIPLQRYSKWVN